MPRFEVLECPRLPSGYALRIYLLHDDGWNIQIRISALNPARHRTLRVPGLHKAAPRRLALSAAVDAVRTHLHDRQSLYPASVRNRITTWLNTLIAPIENEQQLF